jgi:hypothetical protein
MRLGWMLFLLLPLTLSADELVSFDVSGTWIGDFCVNSVCPEEILNTSFVFDRTTRLIVADSVNDVDASGVLGDVFTLASLGPIGPPPGHGLLDGTFDISWQDPAGDMIQLFNDHGVDLSAPGGYSPLNLYLNCGSPLCGSTYAVMAGFRNPNSGEINVVRLPEGPDITLPLVTLVLLIVAIRRRVTAV